MKKLQKYLFLILLLSLLIIPSTVFACDKVEVRVKLGINNEAKECRAFIYEAVGGYYKQMPAEEWRLVKFEHPNSEFFQKYCEAIGYSYSDDTLLPQRLIPVNWKLCYSIISILIAIGVLTFPFIKFKKNKGGN